MAKLFRRSFYFWAALRVVLIVLLSALLLKQDFHNGQSTKRLGFICIYLFVMVMISIKDLTGQEKILRHSRFAGIVSILISVAIIAVWIYYPKDIDPLAKYIGISGFFVGLFDVMNVHRNEINYPV